MNQVLFPLVLVEMGLTLILSFDTPVLRKLLIMGLDRMKQGRGPLVVKTVAGTLFVVFMSSVYGVMETHRRLFDRDEVLLAYHLLEASLMGFCLFLGLIIDRLHYHVKELHRISNSLVEVKQLLQDANVKSRGKDESKVLEQGVSLTRTKDKPLKSEPPKTQLKEADPKPTKKL